MASVLTVDCIHDNSEDENYALNIVDVEWSKLESSHRKDGYREGYSAGQERALQPAFNRGFAEQVKVETRAAFYKGILTALKTLSEKSSSSNRPDPSVNLTAGDGVKLESLLAELDVIASGSGSNRDTVDRAAPQDESRQVPRTDCCRDSDPSPEGASADKRTDMSEEDVGRTQCCRNEQGCSCKGTQHPRKNASFGGIATHNEGGPCGKLSQSMNVGLSTASSGNHSVPLKPEGKSAKEPMAVATSDFPVGYSQLDIPEGGTSDIKYIARNCEQLLKQQGIEHLLLENQYTKDI